MIGNIDYIMTYGNVTGNPETAEIWERLEMTIQDFQVAARRNYSKFVNANKGKKCRMACFQYEKETSNQTI